MLFHFPHLVAVLKSSSSESRDYKQEYADFHGKPSQIKARAERNAARRKLGIPKGDPREADHKNPISNGGSNSSRNLRAVSRSTNRRKGASVKKDGDWEEGKHPRADNGQFGSGSGGSSKPASKKPSKTKRKLDRRAEEASQGKVTGAIQSLLTGGSALDNVKWFKQPDAPKAEEKKPDSKPAPAKPKEQAPTQSQAKPSIPGAGQLADVSDIFPRGVSGGIPVKGNVDFTKPYKLVVSGNTYGYKDNLKSEGFTFNSSNKTWEKAITPPDKPNPYGGTLEENQHMALASAISSAGRGKGASRNLTGEIVQGDAQPTSSAPRQTTKEPSVTREMAESYRRAYPGAKTPWKRMDAIDLLDSDIVEGGRRVY